MTEERSGCSSIEELQGVRRVEMKSRLIPEIILVQFSIDQGNIFCRLTFSVEPNIFKHRKNFTLKQKWPYCEIV